MIFGVVTVCNNCRLLFMHSLLKLHQLLPNFVLVISFIIRQLGFLLRYNSN